MKRRQFIVSFASVIAAWPLELRAQKSPAVVGFLGGQATPPPKDAQGNALLDGFRNNGLIPGRDFVFEARFTGGDDEQFPELARELARLKARVILANTPSRPARSRNNTEELGTVVKINGSIKVKWNGGRTSYFRHGDPGNIQLNQPSKA